MADFYWEDIILDEEKTIEASNLIVKYCNELNSIYTAYINILTGIKDEAIMSGTAHDAIVAYLELATEINKEGEFLQAVSTATEAKDSFVYEFDGADTYLYGER